jgi:amidase/6-aminohexanoate-cyclic-dimer hydrolase
VAAGITPLANASDGGGSIRIPASCCGLFGLKPTRMRVPLGPDRAEGWSGLSCVHAVTRSVRDSAALLDASAGPEPGDPYWAPPPARPFLQEVGADPGQLRIALLRSPPSGAAIDPECRTAAETAAGLCESLGHAVEEAAPPVDYEQVGRGMQAVIGVSVRLTLERRARELGRELRESDVEPVTWSIVKDAPQVSGAALVEAREAFHRASRVLARFQERYDVLLSPTLGRPPVELGRLSLSQDAATYFREVQAFSPFSSLANVTGQPSMSVPLHWTASGLPVGVMFTGRFGDEATLLRLAAQLEQARPWAGRRPAL